MVTPIKSPNFASRRRRNGSILLAALILTFILAWAYEVTLHSLPYATGWCLLVLVLFLTFFNIRKRFPFLPLLPAATWMQMHAYAGLFTLVLFFLHTGWKLPSGRFETLLWIVFLIVGLSGVVGMTISRIIPIRLKHLGEPIFRDRIGFYRAQLAKEVEEIILSSMNETKTRTLAKLYTARLRHFFAAPRSLLEHLLGQRESIDKLLRDIDSANRYLDAPGNEVLAKVREKVLQKDELDLQYSNLLVLRIWLFIHIPATYSLLLLAILHLSLAYGFGMGTL